MLQKIIIGAGCFWGIEQHFFTIKGVVSTEVGYSGGKTENPSYREICSGNTGHAEVLKIVIDDDMISFNDILKEFWAVHNPTTMNQQGPDVGSQYRSVIFYIDDIQKQIAENSIEKNQCKFDRPIVTQVIPFKKFYVAEEYHQKYFQKNTGQFCGFR
ncbi:MAG: peptide-methionine (S)-S-oxide reductase [Francisellaceae bacterium]|jgi:peptide-methionine (S)-S-oxide reductase